MHLVLLPAHRRVGKGFQERNQGFRIRVRESEALRVFREVRIERLGKRNRRVIMGDHFLQRREAPVMNGFNLFGLIFSGSSPIG
jgi:hypothetical protein